MLKSFSFFGEAGRVMFKNYIKTAFRSLTKNKAYSFLNIFGLSIGIACAALIFLWVEDEVNYDSVNCKKRPALPGMGKPEIRYLYIH